MKHIPLGPLGPTWGVRLLQWAYLGFHYWIGALGKYVQSYHSLGDMWSCESRG